MLTLKAGSGPTSILFPPPRLRKLLILPAMMKLVLKWRSCAFLCLTQHSS